MTREELAPLLAGIFQGEDHLVESAARARMERIVFMMFGKLNY